MPATSDERERILACLRRFLKSTGRVSVELNDRTHLTRDLGLSSDEGLDFVCDLCEEFGFDFPMDFNPFVHESGRRGRRIGEMIKAVLGLVPVEEAAV